MDGWEEELLRGEFMTKRRLTEKFPRSSRIDKRAVPLQQASAKILLLPTFI